MSTENETKDLHSATNDNDSSPDEQIEHPVDNQAKGNEGETFSNNAEAMRKRPPSAVKAALFASAVAVILGAGTYWYTTIQIPINEATNEFNKAATCLESRNAELDKAILDLQEVLKSGETPLDPSLADVAALRLDLHKESGRKHPNAPKVSKTSNPQLKKLNAWANMPTK